MGILVSFLTSEVLDKDFLHLVWCSLWIFHIYLLLCLDILSLDLHCLGHFLESMLSFKKCFLYIYWYDHKIFVGIPIYVVYSIYWLEYVKPPCISRMKKVNLVTVGYLFGVCVYSIFKYFTEHFWKFVHQGYWPIVFLFIVLVLGWYCLHRENLWVLPLFLLFSFDCLKKD